MWFSTRLCDRFDGVASDDRRSTKRGNSVKIDDVSVTIFAWDNIPVTIYHQGATAASGSNLGLLRIRTDAGLEGYASSGRPAIRPRWMVRN